MRAIGMRCLAVLSLLVALIALTGIGYGGLSVTQTDAALWIGSVSSGIGLLVLTVLLCVGSDRAYRQ